MNHIISLAFIIVMMDFDQVFGSIEYGHSIDENTGSRMDLDLANSFLAVHNELRRKVALGMVKGQPEAADMSEIKWNKELAFNAQKWADKCEIRHDTHEMRKTEQFPFVGQNWGGMKAIQKAIIRWFDEHKNYYFDSNTCSKEPCGHYTQMVWSWITHVGCGLADCSHKKGFSFSKTVVCDYGPGGNMKNAQPYIKGKACSKCLPDQPYCSNGLCTDNKSHESRK